MSVARSRPAITEVPPSSSAAAEDETCHSAAWLDAVVCPVMVDARALEQGLLAARGLIRVRLPRVEPGRHPIVIEAWRVREGHLKPAGVEVHALWQGMGATVGGGLGGLLGAGAGLGAGLFGAAAHGFLRQERPSIHRGLDSAFAWAGWAERGARTTLAAAAAGASVGSKWFGAAARLASESTSHLAGSYDEVLITVPGVELKRGARSGPGGSPSPGGDGQLSLVVGMYSDSALSRWGERLFGFGFQKKRAQVRRDADGGVELMTPAGEPLLEVSVDSRVAVPGPRAATADATAEPGAARRRRALAEGGRGALDDARPIVGALALPLVGFLDAGTPVTSRLTRTFDDPGVRMKPVRARLRVHLRQAAEDAAGVVAAAGIGLATGPIGLEPIGPTHPWGAFCVTGLPVSLSYPRSLRPPRRP